MKIINVALSGLFVFLCFCVDARPRKKSSFDDNEAFKKNVEAFRQNNSAVKNQVKSKEIKQQIDNAKVWKEPVAALEHLAIVRVDVIWVIPLGRQAIPQIYIGVRLSDKRLAIFQLACNLYFLQQIMEQGFV